MHACMAFMCCDCCPTSQAPACITSMTGDKWTCACTYTYLVRPWPLGQCLDALSYHLVKNIGNIIIIRAHSHSAVSNCCEVLDGSNLATAVISLQKKSQVNLILITLLLYASHVLFLRLHATVFNQLKM